MPKLDAVEIGNPCWADIMSSDTTATRAFYTALLGWEADEPNEEFGGYINFTKDGSRIAGAMATQDGDMPDVWSIYIAVADAEATCKAVDAAGGTVMMPPMPVGDLGSMAVVLDVGGAAIGMWQPGEHKGFGYVAEPGAPGWFELHTKAYDASLDFYRDAFGWDLHTMSDEPEFRYTTLHADEAAAAGIMDSSNMLPAEVPSHWVLYFAVADADASASTIVELGGSIERPPEDTPYGRLVAAVDPTGARFNLVGPNVAS